MLVIGMEERRGKIISKAIEAIQSGHRNYAISLLRHLLKLNPDDIQARKLLFKALHDPLSTKKTSKVRSFLLKLKAESLLRNGQVAKALETLQLAYELNPNNTAILVSITEILSSHNPQAVELLEPIDVQHLHDVNLLKRIARVYLNCKNLSLAKEALKRILIISPHDLETQKMLKNLEALGVLEKEFKPA